MDHDDVAIVGFSFKLPQGVHDELAFWETLQERKNLMTEWPESRIKLEAFYSSTPQENKLNSRGAHFLADDPAAFDAPFFAITAQEAAAMDPQQRYTLETAYHAFENAGIPMDKLKGSRTAVFAASMSDDYARMYAKDPDNTPRTAIIGIAPTILSNRISWYFDLTGPSIHVDTACSSSMIGIDLACSAIKNGDASTALVTGVNLLLGAEASIALSNMGFLSPSSLCYSFDHRANGYARGEGVIALVMKSVTQAIQDGDTIRAIIRSSGSNQDGRTPVLTQPSAALQESLIRDVYNKAGLSFDYTRYVEAHGTGTPIGDPIEVKALSNVFGSSRSSSEPLYIGSVKSNIGHLEGCSGLAGIVKAVLALEKGVIPPNALLEKVNPSIDLKAWNVMFPTESILWPAGGLRRASVNSFGFGGSNAHVVLDDAYHYLAERGIAANHFTLPSPSVSANMLEAAHNTADERSPQQCNRSLCNEVPHKINHHSQPAHSGGPGTNFGRQLLVWTAPDHDSLVRVVKDHTSYYQSRIQGNTGRLRDLSYTLSTRRSHFLWRTFAVVDGASLDLSIAEPVRSSPDVRIAFLFTGQGAQHTRMGMDLVQYPVFLKTLIKANKCLRTFGCEWSIIDELQNDRNIDRPDFSQPLCTAVQIALVELMASFGITPSVVVGHSSGEIAAAYTCGALSLHSACAVSYYRGKVTARLWASGPSAGCMMSVNLPASEVHDYLATYNLVDSVHISCINSPLNVTLSGQEDTLDRLKTHLDQDKIFAHKLNTGVAYHSPIMKTVASEYIQLLEGLRPKHDSNTSRVVMVSSVTGKVVSQRSLCTPIYWADNLVLKVDFANALRNIVSPSETGPCKITDLVEVGPHSALRRPVREVIGSQDSVTYSSVLSRMQPQQETFLRLLGHLWTQGYPVTMGQLSQRVSINGPVLLVDCPRYPFDHSEKYWVESRMSRDYRLRELAPGDLLGFRVNDWNNLDPRWRNLLSLKSSPWIGDHVVSNTILLPATGMIVMALEAVRQIAPSHREISGFYMKKCVFTDPVAVSEFQHDKTETYVRLTPVQTSNDKYSAWADVTIFTRRDDQWHQCSQSRIKTLYNEPFSEVDAGREEQLHRATIQQNFKDASESCNIKLNSHAFYQFTASQGIKYGDMFRLLDDISFDGSELAMARVTPAKHQCPSLVHPAVLDAAFQLLMVQASKGLLESTSTCVPYQISGAWFSSAGWQNPGTSFQYLARSQSTSPHGNLVGALHVVSTEMQHLCSIDTLLMKPVSSRATKHTQKDGMLHSIEWQPQISMLDPQQLYELCSADSTSTNEEEAEEYWFQLQELLDVTIQSALADVQHAQNSSGHLQRYRIWLERYAGQISSTGEGQECTRARLEELIQKCEDAKPEWKYVLAIAKNLTAILKEEVDPLEIAFESDLVGKIYDDIFKTICDQRFHRLLQLISHQKPHMKVLEIGAGTGGFTERILSILGDLEDATGGSRFSTYVYTDISAGFFDKAKDRFARFEDRMQFRVLDIERDIGSQGFDSRSYDLIIAGGVLHATRDLTTTLDNVNDLLLPGGHLINGDLTQPASIAMNLAFGVLPGWWLHNDKWRGKGFSPLLTETGWIEALRETGFTGVDLQLRDYHSDTSHIASIMLSTACRPDANKELPASVWLLGDFEAQNQTFLAASLETSLKASEKYAVKTTSWEEMTKHAFSDSDVVICLSDLERPVLANLSSKRLELVKRLMQSSKKTLWVSTSQTQNSQLPSHGFVEGFLRSMRHETIDIQLVLLKVDSPTDLKICAKSILDVFHQSFELSSPEIEYRVETGKVLSGRLIEEIAANENMLSLAYRRTKEEPWASGPPLKLDVGSRGLLETLQFVEDVNRKAELDVDEVEIEAASWGLSFRDVFVALGRMDDNTLGLDCAGIISRVHPSCASRFKPGDRVCSLSIGCMRSHVQTSADSVIKIPDHLSFDAAASLIAPAVTAYHSLLKVARLGCSDKILIHSAAGGTGQLALWIAKMTGAEIFATVGSNEKRKFLIEKFGIVSDHIFDSRNTTFASGIKRMTNGMGVDVVLNSLSGDLLNASWDCIAPYGRFIEIGKSDILADSSLPMANFARNVSFCAVDVVHLLKSNTLLMRQLLQDTLDLFSRNLIHPPAPIHAYTLPNLEQAFRYFQSGKNIGRTVISIRPDDTVKKEMCEPSSWLFDRNASYVVAGGLGGLGRAILQWMVKKGAKHLIVPSRSGPCSQAARDLVDRLQRDGVNVLVPKCDVTSEIELSALLQSTSATMPPIKGCINAAMALQDATLSNMTYDRWQTTVNSKAATSWNLHTLLPKGLDFFVQLSSLAGITGTPGQSNYAAGCTFQDALASHRIRHGEKAVAIDLGWMSSIGIIAENEVYLRNRQNAVDMREIQPSELFALLDMYCNNVRPLPNAAKDRVIVGIMTPTHRAARGLAPLPFMQQPAYSPFFPRTGHSEVRSNGDYKKTPEELFKQAKTAAARAQVVFEALGTKLARSLSISASNVEVSKPLSDYGVDSLMAIELRNWISQDFRADIAVFDIMGSASLVAIGNLVSERSSIIVSNATHDGLA